LHLLLNQDIGLKYAFTINQRATAGYWSRTLSMKVGQKLLV